MLSPGNRIVLLPQDREIMDLTGMSEAEYRWFVRECQKNAKIRPGDPVALEPITLALINLAIGILLTVAGALLTPKPKDQERKTLEEETIEGQNVVRRDRFAPKSGFDSFQNVVEMGSIVPIIYCKREGLYGGLRVNTSLLWSQVLSLGGGQFFKGIFLVGESPVTIEYEQTALGNNILSTYDLTKTNDSAGPGRLTAYYNNDERLIHDRDHVAGTAKDLVRYDADVYTVENYEGDCERHHSMAIRPSNQLEFGVHSLIGNNLGYKIGEDFQALSRWQMGRNEYERQNDPARFADRKKQSCMWSTRAGFEATPQHPQGEQFVAVNEIIKYYIYRSSPKDREFGFNDSSSGGTDIRSTCEDVASSISSLQRQFDESINIGDLYKIGSAVGICVARSSSPFVSDNDYDGDGTDVTADFRIVEEGYVDFWDRNTVLTYPIGGTVDNEVSNAELTNGKIVSLYGHIFKLNRASFTVERPAKIVEVGIKSVVGMRCSGVTHFNSLQVRDTVPSGHPSLAEDSYQAYVDAAYCSMLNDSQQSDDVVRSVIEPGSYSAADTRYSFFKISYRSINDTNWRTLTDLFGVRSATSTDIYNYIQFNFATTARYEFRFDPVTSYEIRTGKIFDGCSLFVLDPHVGSAPLIQQYPAIGLYLKLTGVELKKENFDLFELQAFKNTSNVRLGLAPVDDGNYYVDSYARLAEGFVYSGVTTSAASSAEHSISYVNIISENESIPQYDNLSKLGLNIKSSRDLRNLDQLSVYCVRGVIDSHLFPDIFEDLLTNDRYGTGEFFDPAQIEDTSFADSAAWTDSRNYYFDGAITEKINLRTWGAERARDFLLDLSVSGGKFTLNPVLDFNNPMPIAGMFTSGNIIEDTLQVNYFDTQDRLDPIVSVRWREERQNTTLDSRGLFPVIREFNVRRKTKEDGTPVSDNAPIIQVDLSAFCTNREHALDRAKLECQSKRYITHAVSFKTTPSQTGVQAGSIIKLGIETVTYDQPQNGVITANGEVTSWPPLGDGTHNVLLWDGNTLSTRSLTITNGKAVGVTSAVFSLESGTTKADTYKVSSVSFDEDGNVEIEALYWPSAPDGKSLMTVDWDVAGEWEISG